MGGLNKEMIKQVLLLIPAGLLASGVAIVDHIFASRLAASYLYTHSIIVLIPLFLAIVGKSIGHPLLVCCGKESDDVSKGAFITSGLMFGVAIGTTLLAIALVSSKEYLRLFSIPETPANFQYLFLQTTAAIGLLISSFITYALLVGRRSKAILVSNATLFLVNLFGNFLAYYLAQNPDYQFVLFAASSLCSVAVTLVIQLTFIRPYLIWRVKFLLYWKRAKQMILGQTQSFLVAALTPFYLAWVLQDAYSNNLVSIVNVTNSISHFVSLPVFATLGVGALHFSQAISSNDQDSQTACKNAINFMAWCLTGVPTILVILSSSLIVRGLLDIGNEQIYALSLVFGILMVRPLITMAIASKIVALRVYERQRSLARCEFFIAVLSLGILHSAVLLKASCLTAVALFLVAQALIVPCLKILLDRKDNPRKSPWIVNTWESFRP